MLLILVSAASPTAARAHRVSVFAWVQNGQVHVEGQFSRGTPTVGAHVTALSGQRQVFSGYTDAEGLLEFPAPAKVGPDGLLVVLDAGGGHRAEWQIEADEFTAASAEPHPEAHLPDDPGGLDIGLGMAPLLGLAGAGYLWQRRKRG